MTSWKKTFISAFIAQIFSIVGFSFVFPFLPFFIEDLGITDKADQAWWAGIVMSATGISLALLAPIWGVLADRFGRKVMVVRAMIGGSIIVACMSFVQSVEQLVFLRFLQGAATGTIAASVALVASVTPPKRSGLTLGMMQTAVFIGLAVGPLIGGVAADCFGYRIAFRIGAGVILLGGMLVYFGTEEKPRPAPEERAMHHQTFRQIIMTSGFLAAVFVLFIIRFSLTVTNPSFPLIVKDMLTDTSRLNSITGSIVFSVALAGAASSFMLGHFGDRWGQKRILITCSVCAAVISFLHLFVHTIPYLVVVRVLFGLAIAGMIPAANVIIRRSIHESNIGKGFGLATSLSTLGIAVGPLVGGWAAGNFGLYIPFAVAAVGQLVVTAAVILFISKNSNALPANPES